MGSINQKLKRNHATHRRALRAVPPPKVGLHNITHFMRDNGGCSYVRGYLPMKEIAQHTDIKVRKIEKGDDAGHIEKALNPADIVLIPRVAEPQFLPIMEGMQKDGKKVVLDLDDDMFRISPLSPHYDLFGTKNINYKMPSGETLPIWRDGENINLKVNQARLDSIKSACGKADLVTVTTDILAEAYKPYAKKIKVLPNCVDPDLWGKLPLIDDGIIRLFWSGGVSHYEDWCILTDVLPEIFRIYETCGIKLVLLGAKFDGTLKNLPADRIEYYPWVNTYAYPYFVRILNPDIGIIPLQDTEFNRGKSANKWCEYAAMGIPTVASYVSPYKEMSELHKGNNGIFIEGNDTKAWIEGISYLIDDLEDAKNIGTNARQTVLDNFDIHKNYKMWLEAYREII